MFVTRLISGIVLVLGLIAVFVFGEPALTIVFGLLGLAAVYELLRVFSQHDKPLGFLALAGTCIYYVLIYFDMQSWIMFLLTALLVIMLAFYVTSYPRIRIETVAEVFLATVYAGGLLSFVIFTRHLDHGEWLVWLIVIGSWGADTCAYCVGKLIGKHHFSELSPKKTIEGCIGGVVGAGLIAFGYSFFVPETDLFIFSPKIVFPLVAVVSAVVSIFGDLTASAIKRNYDVKDYGRLIPGHGGVMDRFDSVIFVAPFVYYLIVMTSII